MTFAVDVGDKCMVRGWDFWIWTDGGPVKEGLGRALT